MKYFCQLLPLAFALGIFGCASPKPAHQFTEFGFSDRVLSRYKEIAVTAANSPDDWQRLNAKRVGGKPLKLETSNVNYEFDLNHPGLIRLFINTGESTGMHSYYVAVTINRNDDQVVAIEESFWP